MNKSINQKMDRKSTAAASMRQNKLKKKKSCKENMIISLESRWKRFFDIFILILVGYSCFTSVYYVAFSTPTYDYYLLLHYSVETFFYLDLVLNFL